MEWGVYSLKLFMKLGRDRTTQFNGRQTLAVYKQFADKHGAVWFSVGALAKGMAEGKKKELLRAIEQGKRVEMYFAVGKVSDGDNKMLAVADVQTIIIDKDGMASPDRTLTPPQWGVENSPTWIKLANIRYVEDVACEHFRIASTGANLMDVISRSRYHFGYIVNNL